jgi:hypothetical protein
MNTKQVLYNAIAAQLEAKEKEANHYTDEVYNPATNDLKSTILNYFEHNVGGFSSFNFTGTNIRLELGSSWYDRVEITIPNSWREENNEVKLEWNSGNFSYKDNAKENYLRLLNKVYSKFEEITNKYLNEWYPTYISIENKHNEAWKEYKELKSALDNLQREITEDSKEAMKKIGFEIKSFKPRHTLDWQYVGDERKYSIAETKHNIKLQTGRSQYDTMYANGFKVLGKKGNKYKIEVYREGNDSRIHDVLEKKFEYFIDNVNEWENRQADVEKQKVKERYEERTK